MKKAIKVTTQYKCTHDIGITLVITAITFLIDPISTVYKYYPMRDDMGLLAALVIAVIVAVESLMIRLKHFWKWVILAAFSITAASIIRQHQTLGIIHPALLEVVGNGAIFLLFSIPLATVVGIARKKVFEVQNGRRY
jgi:hypothetical protein